MNGPAYCDFLHQSMICNKHAEVKSYLIVCNVNTFPSQIFLMRVGCQTYFRLNITIPRNTRFIMLKMY